jgi:phage protein D
MSERVTPLIYATVRDTSGNSERILEQLYKVKHLQYTDSLAKADKAVLTIDNYDLSNFDDPIWAHRNIVELTWGYPGNMSLVREMVITKVTGFTELKVEARAKSIILDAVKRSRTFQNKSRGDVVRIIAKEYGYTEDQLFIDDTGVKLPFITQARLSDAQLIRRLAHQQGFDFYVDQDGFHWKERKLVQSPLRAFVWFTDQGRGDVLSIDIEKDVTKRPAKVSVVSRDPLDKKTTTSTATDTSDKEREGTASILLIKEADLRQGTLVYVPETAGPSTTGPGNSEREAKAKYRAGQRGAVKMNLTAVGDPTMLAKSLVSVSGVGQRLTGNYHVNEVVHDVGPGKYTIKCKLASDGGGPTSKRTQSRLENGLPDVTPTASHAKKTAEQAQTQASGKNPANSRDPDALIPVPILDAKGNTIGTGWKPKESAGVAIQNGKAVRK